MCNLKWIQLPVPLAVAFCCQGYYLQSYDEFQRRGFNKKLSKWTEKNFYWLRLGEDNRKTTPFEFRPHQSLTLNQSMRGECTSQPEQKITSQPSPKAHQGMTNEQFSNFHWPFRCWWLTETPHGNERHSSKYKYSLESQQGLGGNQGFVSPLSHVLSKPGCRRPDSEHL